MNDFLTNTDSSSELTTEAPIIPKFSDYTSKIGFKLKFLIIFLFYFIASGSQTALFMLLNHSGLHYYIEEGKIKNEKSLKEILEILALILFGHIFLLIGFLILSNNTSRKIGEHFHSIIVKKTNYSI